MGKTFVYNTGKDEVPTNEIWIEFGLFFDGTLNNKDNTELREKVEKGTATALELEVYKAGSKRSLKDEQGVDNSYSNDYTNVARLWKNCDRREYAIYVEGIGTITKAQDDSDGFMFGAGKAGIRQKVREGCKDLAKKIGDVKKGPKKGVTKKKLTRVTIDVFGFSRGAAAARNFVYEVNVKQEYMPNGYMEHKANENDRKRKEERDKKKKESKMRGGDVKERDGIHVTHPLYKSRPISDSDDVEVSEFLLRES